MKMNVFMEKSQKRRMLLSKYKGDFHSNGCSRLRTDRNSVSIVENKVESEKDKRRNNSTMAVVFSGVASGLACGIVGGIFFSSIAIAFLSCLGGLIFVVTLGAILVNKFVNK